MSSVIHPRTETTPSTEAYARPGEDRSSTTTLWFVAILLLAAGLRIFQVGAWDMWTDEVQTLWTSQSMEFKEGPMYRTAPVNFVLTGLVVRAGGASEVTARMVPLLAGILTVALCYLLFNGWVGRRAALFATLILALSLWHIFWSQTARHFSIQTLFITIGIYAFLRFWRDRRLGAAPILALLLIASLFVHSSSGFYLAALLAFLVIVGIARVRTAVLPETPPPPRRLLAIGIAAVAAPLILYVPVYLQVGSYLMENKVAWNVPGNILGSLAFYIPPYLAIPAVAGAAFLWWERNDLALLLGSLVVVPMVLVLVAANFTIASGAYCIASIIAIALLAGTACDRILTLAGPKLRVPTAILVSTIFISQCYDLAHYYTFYNGLKPRWKEVTEFIARNRGEAELVLAAEGDVAQFYLGREGVDWLGNVDRWRGDGDEGAAGIDGIWYAIYLEGDPAAPQAVIDEVRQSARLVTLFPLHYGAKDRTIALYYEALR